MTTDYTLFFDKDDNLRFFVGDPGEHIRAMQKANRTSVLKSTPRSPLPSVLDIEMQKNEEAMIHIASILSPSWKMDFEYNAATGKVTKDALEIKSLSGGADSDYEVIDHDIRNKNWVLAKRKKGNNGDTYKFNLLVKNIVTDGTASLVTKVIIDPVIKNRG